MAEQVGFAKLCGQGLEYVVQKYTITMGRCSKTTTVDLTLGNNMNLSRHHASITYNFDSGESVPVLRVSQQPPTVQPRRFLASSPLPLTPPGAHTGSFELQVLGKNGVSVADQFVGPGHAPVPLCSQDRVQVADVVFYFLLPPSNANNKRPRVEPAEADADSKKPKVEAAAVEAEA